jgi:hypothetical protein
MGLVAAGLALDVQNKGFALNINPGYNLSSLGKDFHYPAAVFAVAAFVVAAFMLWLTIALWRGRKWSLWFMFLTHLPSALFSGYSRDFGPSAFALAVTIYTFLRISGNAGPRL